MRDYSLFMRDFVEDLNGNDDYIDANCRKKAVLLYGGKFYFGHTHGGILSHILKGTDTMRKNIWRSTSRNFDKKGINVAFGNLIEKDILIFEDLQDFWGNFEGDEDDEKYYTLDEITELIKENKDLLKLTVDKAYTVLRTGKNMYSAYDVESIKEIF